MRLVLDLVELVLLAIVQEQADLPVSAIMRVPEFAHTIFVGQALVLNDLYRGGMQLLQDRFDFLLLLAGEIQLRRQKLQLPCGSWNADVLPARRGRTVVVAW